MSDPKDLKLLVVTVATDETDGYQRFMKSCKHFNFNVKVSIYVYVCIQLVIIFNYSCSLTKFVFIIRWTLKHDNIHVT